jgi:chemotaxis protein MotB
MAESNSKDERPVVIRRVKKVVGGGHHGGAWKVA